MILEVSIILFFQEVFVSCAKIYVFLNFKLSLVIKDSHLNTCTAAFSLVNLLLFLAFKSIFSVFKSYFEERSSGFS